MKTGRWRRFPEAVLADRTLAQVPGTAFGWAWPFAPAPPPLSLSRSGSRPCRFSPGVLREPTLFSSGSVRDPLAYMGYNGGTSLHGYGPRYYADGFFALFVLTARGFQVLGGLCVATKKSNALSAALFSALCLSAAIFLPYRLSLARDYNAVDDRVERRLREHNITRGLILLDEPSHLLWIRAARLLTADGKADLVFANKRNDNAPW